MEFHYRNILAIALFGWILILGTAYGAQHPSPKVIKVAMPVTFPPYVIAESDSGIQYQIIESALAKQNIRLEPVYLPFKRIPKAYEQRDVDAVLHLKQALEIDGFSSQDLLEFHSYVVFPKQSRVKVRSISQLSEYKIGAWQGASEALGNRFRRTMKFSRRYQESASFLPVSMLLGGRFDGVIAEPSTFQYYLEHSDVSDKVDIRDFEFFDFFSAGKFCLTFREESHLSFFQNGLEQLKASGDVSKIASQYTKDYPLITNSVANSSL